MRKMWQNDKVDPACVKTHTSEKCRKYNSLTRYRAVCAQYDLTLMMRNRFEIFLRTSQALEFLHSQDPYATSNARSEIAVAAGYSLY